MFRKLRARLTYANIVSSLALFLVLSGGTAVALTGSNTVFSDDITDQQVRTADIRNDEVRTGDVRDSTLRGRDVFDNSLTGADINESSLGNVRTGGPVRNNDATEDTILDLGPNGPKVTDDGDTDADRVVKVSVPAGFSGELIVTGQPTTLTAGESQSYTAATPHLDIGLRKDGTHLGKLDCWFDTDGLGKTFDSCAYVGNF